MANASAHPQSTPAPIADNLARMTKHSPIVSEFETDEEAQAHDAWARAKIAASLADPRPSVPHDQVMAHIREILAVKHTRQQYP